MFPLFFLISFAGGLSSVAKAPGFDYPAGYTAFQFGFVGLQASAFGGVFQGFAIAAMFESGFGRRDNLVRHGPIEHAVARGTRRLRAAIGPTHFRRLGQRDEKRGLT